MVEFVETEGTESVLVVIPPLFGVGIFRMYCC